MKQSRKGKSGMDQAVSDDAEGLLRRANGSEVGEAGFQQRELPHHSGAIIAR